MTAGRTNHTKFAQGTPMAEYQPKDDWKHLLPYGYAPGQYMGKCMDCKEVKIDLDKRAIRCRVCAQKAFDQGQKA